MNEFCDKCPTRFELLAGRHLMVYLESVITLASTVEIHPCLYILVVAC